MEQKGRKWNTIEILSLGTLTGFGNFSTNNPTSSSQSYVYIGVDNAYTKVKISESIPKTELLQATMAGKAGFMLVSTAVAKGAPESSYSSRYIKEYTYEFNKEKGLSPYLYSEDENGELYFEHEPIAYSLLKSSVEGTTYGTLRLLQDQNGIYYIQIIEEGDSITAINNANIYTIDYEANQGVIDAMFDVYGNPHTIKNRISPISFVDQKGVSKLAEILQNDELMAKVSDNDELLSYFIATFEKPSNASHVKLMFTPREPGNYILSPILDLINAKDNLWWLDQAFMNDAENRMAIENFFDMILDLRIEVWNGSEWVLQASVDPKTYINEEMLVILNLEGIDTDYLKVRFLFPTGNDFHFDSVYVDYSENVKMNVNKLELYSAILNGTTDVKDLLLYEQGYVYIKYKESVRLGFISPELAEGYERAFGVSMKGYIYSVQANIEDDLLDQTIGKSFEEIKSIIQTSGREELINYVDAIEELYYILLNVGNMEYEDALDYMNHVLAGFVSEMI